MSSRSDERAGVPRLARFLYFSRARGGERRPRSKRAQEACAWLAETVGVEEAMIVGWANGQEPIPEELIEPLAEVFGVSVEYLMRWEDAPRGVIPDCWRQRLAEDAAVRAAAVLPRECEGLLHWIEWRLRVDADLGAPSPDLPRLQRLRSAVLEFLAEPIEGDA